MRYNDNREVNEMEHRDNGERTIVDSSQLLLFLGDDNYLNKAEEMLLDILNQQYPLEDALKDISEHWNNNKNDVLREYTVFVGGVEMNDSLLDLSTAEELAQVYIDDQYEDVQIVKVEV